MDLDVDPYVLLLPKSHKKQKAQQCYCILCDCTFVNVSEHALGKTHKRLAKIQSVLQELQRSNIDWQDKRKKEFYCSTCDKKMPVQKQDLLNHAANHVIPVRNLPMPNSSTYVGSAQNIVHRVSKLVRTKEFWESYDPKEDDLEQVYAPISLQDPSGELVHLMNGVFTKEEIKCMTGEAQWLEREASITKRGEKKEGTRIATFGVRFKYGHLAWYKHPNSECYIRSEHLARVMAKGLQRRFPSIFEHLENARDLEGVKAKDSRIGSSPFSSISVTKDYNVKTHCDNNDFSYGFFLWLGNSGTFKNGNGVRFYLPEVGCFLEPQVGDVLLMKASEIHHCTRTTGRPRQLGIALYLQTSLLHWWSVINRDVERMQSGMTLDGKEAARAHRWLENNHMYQACISGSKN